MPTLHQLFLMVTDVDETVAFYRDALGLDVVDRGDRSATFETGRCSLVVERDFDAETLSAFGLSPPGDSRGDGAIVVLEVDDVDAVYDRATAADADTVLPPTDVDWGRRMFLVRDPDGYVVEVSRPTE